MNIKMCFAYYYYYTELEKTPEILAFRIEYPLSPYKLLMMIVSCRLTKWFYKIMHL